MKKNNQIYIFIILLFIPALAFPMDIPEDLKYQPLQLTTQDDERINQLSLELMPLNFPKTKSTQCVNKKRKFVDPINKQPVKKFKYIDITDDNLKRRNSTSNQYPNHELLGTDSVRNLKTRSRCANARHRIKKGIDKLKSLTGTNFSHQETLKTAASEIITLREKYEILEEKNNRLKKENRNIKELLKNLQKTNRKIMFDNIAATTSSIIIPHSLTNR